MSDEPKLAEDKVHAALSEEQEGKTRNHYMGDLLANIRSADDRLRAATRATVLLLIVFELLTRATISKISFAGLEVQDTSLVQKSLPAILAYLIYWSTIILVHKVACMWIYRYLMQEILPHYYKNDLADYPLPPSIFETPGLIASLEGWGGKMTFYVLNIPVFLLILLGPAVSESYAFYRLFDLYGSHDVIVWASLILTVYFLCGVYVGSIATGFFPRKLRDRIPKKVAGAPGLPGRETPQRPARVHDHSGR